MQLLFIDESGSPPTEKNAADVGYFVLGGVVIPEEVWIKLAADLKRIKQSYTVTGEIKWRHFTKDRGGKPTPLSHLSIDQKESLRAELYKAFSSYKAAKIISVVAHGPSCYGRTYVGSPDDIYWLCYKQLTERFQYMLQDLSRMIGHSVHGIVVCDNRGPQDDEKLRNLHATLMSSDGDFVSRYQNIIEGLFIAPSHLSVGIQFADLIAGAIFRKFKANDERFYKQIEGAIRTSPAGRIEGYGLVKFPKGTW